MYDKLFKKVLYPLYETGIKRRRTLQYLDLLNDNQWLSLDELKAKQWSSLTSLLEHAYNQSPFYQQAFDQIGLKPQQINSYNDFSQLPICTRQDIVDNKNKMIAHDYHDKILHKSTGGSTGMPVQFALDKESYQWRTAAAQRGYQWAGCEAGQSTVYLWGVDVGTPSKAAKLKTDLYHKIFNRKMFNCFDLTDEVQMECLEYLNRNQPNGIVAFTSAIYNLAKFAQSIGISMKPIPAVVTGAEKLHCYQRELIEEIFHTKVFNTYGCREFMLIAAECEKHEGLHVTMDNLFVEILNSDGSPTPSGEAGDVVITDLHNYGMPFIRYKNGDIATQSDKRCSCGRGLPLIGKIDGRIMDEIVATDGKSVSGGFFPHLMKEFEEIGKFQVIQKTVNYIQVKLSLKEDLSKNRLDFCDREIKKVLGSDMNIDYEFVDDIPLTLTGKYRVTISEIR